MPIYDRPVRVLMREMVEAIELDIGQSFTRDEAIDWFKTHFPLVKEGTITAHLTRLSTNNRTRLHYKPKADDDVLFQVDSARYRRYEAEKDPPPIHENSLARFMETATAPAEVSEEGSSEFAYEHEGVCVVFCSFGKGAFESVPSIGETRAAKPRR
jgi:hypothetical protein